jgi:hypothetical protein
MVHPSRYRVDRWVQLHDGGPTVTFPWATSIVDHRVTTVRKATLRVAGSVALGAAATQIASGARGVRSFDWRMASDHLPKVALSSLDSELRFYAVWYGVAGFLMHRAASDETFDWALHPVIAIGWGGAALSRLLSLRRTGAPDRLFLALAGMEAALASVLVTTK